MAWGWQDMGSSSVGPGDTETLVASGWGTQRHRAVSLCPQFPALGLKLALLLFGGHLVAAGTVTPGELVTVLMCQLDFTRAVEVTSVVPCLSPVCHLLSPTCPQPHFLCHMSSHRVPTPSRRCPHVPFTCPCFPCPQAVP